MSTTVEKMHLARVAGLGCWICAGPAVPHHVRILCVGAGMGLKVSDYDTIPLCDRHHTTGGRGVAYHAGKEIWETNFGSEIGMLQEVRLELGLSPLSWFCEPCCIEVQKQSCVSCGALA